MKFSLYETLVAFLLQSIPTSMLELQPHLLSECSGAPGKTPRHPLQIMKEN